MTRKSLRLATMLDIWMAWETNHGLKSYSLPVGKHSGPLGSGRLVLAWNFHDKTRPEGKEPTI